MREEAEVKDMVGDEDLADISEPVKDEQLLPRQIRIDWPAEDKQTIDLIRAEARKSAAKEFFQAAGIMHRLLSKVRDQAIIDGQPLFDEDGEPVWETWEDGTVKEDWSRLTDKEMDEFIMNMSVFSFFAAQKVMDAYAEAVYAKYANEDAYADAYSSVLSGTIADKEAKARRQTMQERYRAFYMAFRYRYMKEMLDRIDATVRRFEGIRRLRTEDRWRMPQDKR